jgi:methylenetetrahydrofolate dehydrogenase (NADP+)/methenyltetrahydrofolate cyclohydrolase/formyltetrahydrofolate synthetase
VEAGFVNLLKHIENVHLFGVPVVVAINSFATDSNKECELVQRLCKQAGAFDAVICDHWSQGGTSVLSLSSCRGWNCVPSLP